MLLKPVGVRYGNEWRHMDDHRRYLYLFGKESTEGYDQVMDTVEAAARLQTSPFYFGEAGRFGAVYSGVADDARRRAVMSECYTHVAQYPFYDVV
jgi:hypothetical protein